MGARRLDGRDLAPRPAGVPELRGGDVGAERRPTSSSIETGAPGAGIDRERQHPRDRGGARAARRGGRRAGAALREPDTRADAHGLGAARVGAGRPRGARQPRRASPVADDHPASRTRRPSATRSTRRSTFAASRTRGHGAQRLLRGGGDLAARQDGACARERRPAAARIRPAAFLRWRGALPFGAPELEQLVERRRPADRRLDASGPSRDRGVRSPARRCSSRSSSPTSPGRRIEPWRRAACRLWPDVATPALLRSEAREPRRSCSRGWLGTRLGRPLELEHEPADARTSSRSTAGSGSRGSLRAGFPERLSSPPSSRSTAATRSSKPLSRAHVSGGATNSRYPGRRSTDGRQAHRGPSPRLSDAGGG